jgi:hypothetical protein
VPATTSIRNGISFAAMWAAMRASITAPRLSELEIIA